MKLFRCAVSIIIIFCIVFTFFIGKNLLDEDTVIISKGDYKGVLTLWQIDSFEGGTGSRKQFLLKIAREFEKKNQGVLVMVINHTVVSAEESMKVGNYPDMISFGNGLTLNDYTTLDLDRNYPSGMIGEKQVSAIWACGKYVLIGNGEKVEDFSTENQKIVISETGYTLPEVAIAIEKITCKEFSVKSPLDAYVDFTSGKVPYLLGTQRDIYRLNNRGFNYILRPIESFSDLNQYISITSVEREKMVYAESFVNYLLSGAVQERLNEIGMFSVSSKVEYQDESMAILEKVKPKNTVSVFLDKNTLLKMRDSATGFLGGNKNEYDNFKKYII